MACLLCDLFHSLCKKKLVKDDMNLLKSTALKEANKFSKKNTKMLWLSSLAGSYYFISLISRRDTPLRPDVVVAVTTICAGSLPPTLSVDCSSDPVLTGLFQVNLNLELTSVQE